jgi:hypothetical protein
MSWPLQRVDTTTFAQMDTYPEEKKEPDVEVMSIRSEGDSTQVVGSADMFDENGNVRLIPVRLAFTPWPGKEAIKLTSRCPDAHIRSKRYTFSLHVVSHIATVD